VIIDKSTRGIDCQEIDEVGASAVERTRGRNARFAKKVCSKVIYETPVIYAQVRVVAVEMVCA
jgi:hypothetical protein